MENRLINMIKAILACDETWGIGKDGDMPWPHNSADLKWFKEKTIGDVVVMGKSTWDSLPFKPLKKRQNLIVTSSKLEPGVTDYQFVKFSEINQKLSTICQTKDIWVIGGAKLIEGLLDSIDEFHLSQIMGVYNCDTFLPKELIKERYLLTQSNKVNDLIIDIWCRK